jgi:hypothetical protein
VVAGSESGLRGVEESVRNPFDQLVKRLVRKGFSPGGRVETEAEVTPDARRVDVWFVPHPGRAREVLRPLGLLGPGLERRRARWWLRSRERRTRSRCGAGS